MSALRAAPKVQPCPAHLEAFDAADRSLPWSGSYRDASRVRHQRDSDLLLAYQIMFEHVARLRGSMTGPRPGAALMTLTSSVARIGLRVGPPDVRGPPYADASGGQSEARSHGARTWQNVPLSVHQQV